MERPLILVTNDDSYKAPGIQLLAEIAQKYGDVVVLAPDAPQSAQSSALTVETPLRVNLLEEKEGYKCYKTNGKPTDCVKLALNKILLRTPDFIFSGINHGSNASVNVLYSGTMGAAIEGAIMGVPSVGFSIDSHSWQVDLSKIQPYIEELIELLFSKGMPKGNCWNVNFPKGEIKGLKVCRQSDGMWQKEYAKNTDPNGKDYYWLTGEYKNQEPEATDTDIWALDNGYGSLVPIQYDMTNYEYLKELQKKF